MFGKVCRLCAPPLRVARLKTGLLILDTQPTSSVAPGHVQEGVRAQPPRLQCPPRLLPRYLEPCDATREAQARGANLTVAPCLQAVKAPGPTWPRAARQTIRRTRTRRCGLPRKHDTAKRAPAILCSLAVNRAFRRCFCFFSSETSDGSLVVQPCWTILPLLVVRLPEQWQEGFPRLRLVCKRHGRHLCQRHKECRRD